MFLLFTMVTSLSEFCDSNQLCLPKINFVPEVDLLCYRRFMKRSMIHCTIECLLRQGRCQYIIYNHRFLTCSLCEDSMYGLQTKHLKGDTMVNMSTLNDRVRGLAGEMCVKKVCSRTQRCQPDTGECRGSECDLLPVVPGTTISDVMLSSVGSVVKYGCLDSNVMPLCFYVFKCLSNTQWMDNQIQEIPKDTENFAVGKFASQSSDYYNLGPAMHAVDGNRSPVFNDGCTHTGPQDDLDDAPWWRVDLIGLYWVSRVVIYNRIEFPERLHDVSITIGSNINDMSFCTFFAGPGTPDNLVLDLPCEHIEQVQYVQIQIISGVNNVLALCEVEVY